MLQEILHLLRFFSYLYIHIVDASNLSDSELAVQRIHDLIPALTHAELEAYQNLLDEELKHKNDRNTYENYRYIHDSCRCPYSWDNL